MTYFGSINVGKSPCRSLPHRDRLVSSASVIPPLVCSRRPDHLNKAGFQPGGGFYGKVVSPFAGLRRCHEDFDLLLRAKSLGDASVDTGTGISIEPFGCPLPPLRRLGKRPVCLLAEGDRCGCLELGCA